MKDIHSTDIIENYISDLPKLIDFEKDKIFMALFIYCHFNIFTGIGKTMDNNKLDTLGDFITYIKNIASNMDVNEFNK